jgi:hypothetical protein
MEAEIGRQRKEPAATLSREIASPEPHDWRCFRKLLENFRGGAKYRVPSPSRLRNGNRENDPWTEELSH